MDLIKGIGKLANMEVAEVPGATGYLDTNFTGKMEAAARMFREGRDLVYVHVEAPDECGHRGEAQNKIKAIELIDEKILGPILKELDAYGDYRILIMPDHPTPLSTRTHAADPVALSALPEEPTQGRSGLLHRGYGRGHGSFHRTRPLHYGQAVKGVKYLQQNRMSRTL